MYVWMEKMHEKENGWVRGLTYGIRQQNAPTIGALTFQGSETFLTRKTDMKIRAISVMMSIAPMIPQRRSCHQGLAWILSREHGW
jgi:hypothetical protein